MRKKLEEIYRRVRKIPKRKLIFYSAAAKLIEVGVSAYLIKKFFLH